MFDSYDSSTLCGVPVHVCCRYAVGARHIVVNSWIQVHDQFMSYLDMLHANFKTPPAPEDHEILSTSVISLHKGEEDAQCKCPSCLKGTRLEGQSDDSILDQSVYDVTQDASTHTSNELKELRERCDEDKLKRTDMHRLQVLHLEDAARLEGCNAGLQSCRSPELQCIEIAQAVRALFTRTTPKTGLTRTEISQTATTNFEQVISACENGETLDVTQLEDACDAIDLWLMFEAEHKQKKGSWSPCEAPDTEAQLEGACSEQHMCSALSSNSVQTFDSTHKWAVQGVEDVHSEYKKIVSKEVEDDLFQKHRMQLWAFVLRKYEEAQGNPLEGAHKAWLLHAEMRLLQLRYTELTKPCHDVSCDAGKKEKMELVHQMEEALLKLFDLQPRHDCSELLKKPGKSGTCLGLTVLQRRTDDKGEDFTTRDKEHQHLQAKVFRENGC